MSKIKAMDLASGDEVIHYGKPHKVVGIRPGGEPGFVVVTFSCPEGDEPMATCLSFDSCETEYTPAAGYVSRFDRFREVFRSAMVDSIHDPNGWLSDAQEMDLNVSDDGVWLEMAGDGAIDLEHLASLAEEAMKEVGRG